MGTIKQIRDRYAQAYSSLSDVVSETVAKTADVILDLNRDQMLYGRDADGEVFTPGYLQDPFFETKAEAEHYLRMKMFLENVHKGRVRYTGVQLFPDKNANTPNLIVTGPFQNSMFIRTTKDSYTIDSSYVEADEINDKYRGRVYGLAPRSKEFYYTNWLRPAIMRHYKK